VPVIHRMSLRKHFTRIPIVPLFAWLFRREGARLSRGFLVSLLGVVAFAQLADEMGEGDTAGFDALVRDGVHSFATPLLTQLAVFFSFVGDWPFLTVLGLVIFAFLLYIKWKREALIFMITNVGELVLNITLKGFYQRARPEPLVDYALPPSYSFPSGHALGAFCFFGILAWIMAANADTTRGKLALYLIAGLLVLAIGLSRIYLGVHYPSDVAAGYLIAAVWTLTVIFADRSLLKNRNEADAAPETA